MWRQIIPVDFVGESKFVEREPCWINLNNFYQIKPSGRNPEVFYAYGRSGEPGGRLHFTFKMAQHDDMNAFLSVRLVDHR